MVKISAKIDVGDWREMSMVDKEMEYDVIIKNGGKKLGKVIVNFGGNYFDILFEISLTEKEKIFLVSETLYEFGKIFYYDKTFCDNIQTRIENFRFKHIEFDSNADKSYLEDIKYNKRDNSVETLPYIFKHIQELKYIKGHSVDVFNSVLENFKFIEKEVEKGKNRILYGELSRDLQDFSRCDMILYQNIINNLCKEKDYLIDVFDIESYRLLGSRFQRVVYLNKRA